MAEERFNPGDGVVEKNPDHRGRVWTVYKVSEQYVHVRYKANGKFIPTMFERKELKLLYKKCEHGQMLFFFADC